MIPFQVLVAVFGLIIGSFLTVCIYRIPYGRPKGLESLDEPEDDAAKPRETAADAGAAERLTIADPPRSFCPSCRAQLAWWHNIPLFSWIILGGRCAYCRARIPWTYPAVELLSAAFALLAYNLFDPATALIVYAYCAALIVLCFIDAEYFILPNVITMPGMALAALLAAVNHWLQIFEPPVVPTLAAAGWGLLAGGGFLFAVSEIYFRLRKRVGLGFGDVKLMAWTGLLFGPEVAIGGIFLGSVLGSLIGGLLMLFGGHAFSKPLPFGPYLALGTVICLFVRVENIMALLGGYL